MTRTVKGHAPTPMAKEDAGEAAAVPVAQLPGARGGDHGGGDREIDAAQAATEAAVSAVPGRDSESVGDVGADVEHLADDDLDGATTDGPEGGTWDKVGAGRDCAAALGQCGGWPDDDPYSPAADGNPPLPHCGAVAAA